MQNNNQPNQDQVVKIRKAYHKPQVEQIKLVVEEAVMGVGCKLDGHAGPTNGSCVVNFTPCLIVGS